MTKKTLKVKGMSCQHCEMVVKNAIGKLLGINEVSVDLEDGQVKIVFNENKTNINEIADIINDTGYEVVL